MLFKDLDKEIAKELGLKPKDVREVLRVSEEVLFKTLVKGITIKLPKIIHLKTELRPPTMYYSTHDKKKYLTGKRYILKAHILRTIKNAFREKKVY